MAEKALSLHAFYPSSTGGVEAFLSRPVGPGRWPAVLIIHEWWGLDDHFRDLSRRLAEEGFVALVPDLYHGRSASSPAEAARLKTSLDIDRAAQEILDGIPYLRSLPFVSGKVGIAGFCMGGGLALLAACRSAEFGAAVTYYPSIYPDSTELANLSCPLLIHYGTKDTVTPASEIERIRKSLEKHQKPYEFYLYKNAGHAFLNDLRAHYHREAAETSWPRTVEFLQRHLAEAQKTEKPRPVRFGIYLPNVGWQGLPRPSEIADYAVAAEEMGFDSVWVEDRLLHPRLGILDALATLCYVASQTERIRLGTSVLLVNLRNPLVLAKMLSTLNYLSGGRVVVGASLGGSPEEYGAAGVAMKTRVSRFVETLRAIRAFWGQGSFEGVPRFFQPTELAMEPRPQGRIPIWIGGKAEPVFQRVAALGDGWLASSTTGAEEFARGWAKIREHAAALGRDPTTIEPAKFCYIHIEETTEKALAVLEATLPRYYSFPYDAARLSLYGPPSRCAEQGRRLLEAGVRTLIFSCVTHDRLQMERLARGVLPELNR